jgi:hypothetical protein
MAAVARAVARQSLFQDGCADLTTSEDVRMGLKTSNQFGATPHRASEPVDWRERLIAGMERENARLRAANAPDRQSNDRIS